jgi:hypothetical protein
MAMDDDNLGLLDEEFWADLESRSGKIAGGLRAAGFFGTRIAAPAFVSLAQRDSVPVAVCRVATLADAAKVDITLRALATAVDLDTGDVRASRAFYEDNEEPFEAVPAPPEYAAAIDPKPVGTTAEVMQFDARERLGVPWRPATYLVTLVVLDQVSNRRKVTLQTSPSTYEDPAVKEFLEKERLRIGPPPAGPRAAEGEPFAHFRKRPESPPPPAKPGIAMAAPRVFVLGSATSCLLSGSFRVPLARHQIVPPGPGDAGGAVVPLSLLLTGSKHAEPTTIAMQVPIFDAIDSGAPPETVVGYFAVELLHVEGVADSPQTFFVHAFSGEVLGGPLAVAFVPPELLPHR